MKRYAVMVVLIVLVCFTLVPACSIASASDPAPTAQPDAATDAVAPNWQNVPSINDTTAGDALVLQPIDYSTPTLSMFGSYEFKLSCTPAGQEKPPFKRVMVLSYLENNLQVSETTTFSYVMQWEDGQTSIEVIYPYSNDKKLSGEGDIYLYLADENDVCISNIVKWSIVFE